MRAFYNEIDPYPAQWMRNLINAGHIAPGVVDERSIVDLDPEELRGYTQAHFFAGIGVWSHALRLAGWADDVGVWTGSCPCQPFSAAGKRAGHADERHLWPAWFRLIRECRPRVVFGEQVASKDGLAWLDAVRLDLEGEGYAFGAVDLCAAGAGAPHIRQRAFFVAHRDGGRCEQRDASERGLPEPHANGATGELDYPTGSRRDGSRERPEEKTRDKARVRVLGTRRETGELADAERGAAERHGQRVGSATRGDEGAGRERERLWDDAGHGELAGFWSDAEWVWCRDGVWRPHGPGAFPLTVAHGASARVGRLRAGEGGAYRALYDDEGRPVGQAPSRVGMLRAYGNAIVAPLAAEFVRAAMEAMQPAARAAREGER